ncbi:pyridoxal-phosphate-dependent aminotransferase family protein [Roseovarius sp. CH_XMU1461]|uniref:pyridoxal-phosphate-dependent aminotransferase family protein n=1 Tax=Roseovarius sp. CH_XMU1461 TaxID=3107777 RepID=UPI00300A057E
MGFAQGRSYLAIPGPSVVPDAVQRAMHRAAPNIYQGELVDMMDGLATDLRHVAQTDGYVAIYIANGHGAWEASLANTIAPGDRVLVLATGHFGLGWGRHAEAMGAKVDLLDFGNRATIDPDRIEAALRADTTHDIKAVLVTHVDTSSTVRNDIASVRAALDAAGHPALLMADCIASLGCERFEMDRWGVDVMVSASQKGLMLPPGLGFVWFNDRADAVQTRLDRVSPYWSWTPRAKPEAVYQYFGGTAPTHHLYGLRVALDMIRQEGLDAIWQRHARLAGAIWAATDCWARDGAMRLNISDPALRSHAVTAVSLTAPDASRLRGWTEEMAGVTLGIGLGMAEQGTPAADGFFRIGHMGHVNAHMVLGALGAIEAGLAALDIPHGSGGVSAAARALAAD